MVGKGSINELHPQHSPSLRETKWLLGFGSQNPQHSCSNGCFRQHPNPCFLCLVSSLRTEDEPWSPPCTDCWNPWVPGVSRPCSRRWLPPSGGLHPLLGSAWPPPSGRGFLVHLAGQNALPACCLRTLSRQAGRKPRLGRVRIGPSCAAPTARSWILSPRTLQSLHQLLVLEDKVLITVQA